MPELPICLKDMSPLTTDNNENPFPISTGIISPNSQNPMNAQFLIYIFKRTFEISSDNVFDVESFPFSSDLGLSVTKILAYIGLGIKTITWF